MGSSAVSGQCGLVWLEREFFFFKFVGYQPIKELGINDIIKRFAFSRLLDISQSES